MSKIVYLDSRDLDHSGRATMSGSRRGGRTGKAWRARFRALRRWLLRALGREDFRLGQQLLVEAVSCRRLGGELARDPSSACRFKQRLRDRLKEAVLAAVGSPDAHPGAAAAWVDRLLAGIAAASLADAAFHALKADASGCTVSPRTAGAVRGCDVWAASVAGYEERHHRLTFDKLRSYALRRRGLLFGPAGLHLGVWRARHSVYCLDLTMLFPDQAAAVAFARAHRQQAVTHLGTRQTVWVADLDEGQRRAA